MVIAIIVAFVVVIHVQCLVSVYLSLVKIKYSVCVWKKKKTRKVKDIEDRANTRIKKKKCKGLTKIAPCLNNIFWMSNSVLTSFRF